MVSRAGNLSHRDFHSFGFCVWLLILPEDGIFPFVITEFVLAVWLFACKFSFGTLARGARPGLVACCAAVAPVCVLPRFEVANDGGAYCSDGDCCADEEVCDEVRTFDELGSNTWLLTVCCPLETVVGGDVGCWASVCAGGCEGGTSLELITIVASTGWAHFARSCMLDFSRLCRRKGLSKEPVLSAILLPCNLSSTAAPGVEFRAPA